MIYLDNNATTQIDPEVLEKMIILMKEVYGNPSSLHSVGLKARNLINDGKVFIADTLKCSPDELYFTSGGTETNNIAINGLMRNSINNNGSMLFSMIEHPSVKGMFFKNLKKKGFSGEIIQVDNQGLIMMNDLKEKLKDNVSLVTVMHGNNETGVIEPVEEISLLCDKKNISFHVDAVQTFGKIPVDLSRIRATSMSASSHKIYGPKGTGLLFLRKPVEIEPLFFGGHQQDGLRVGTENVIGILGFIEAFKISCEKMKNEEIRLNKMRGKFENIIKNSLDDIFILSEKTRRIPGTSNICFKDLKSRRILDKLNDFEICCSAGSACAENRSVYETHSPVLDAMNVPKEYINGCIRFSFGRFNMEEDYEFTTEKLINIINSFRKQSMI